MPERSVYHVLDLAAHLDLAGLFALVQTGMDLGHCLDLQHHVRQDAGCSGSRALIRVMSRRPEMIWRLFFTRWWISRIRISFSASAARIFSLACLFSVTFRK